MQWFQSRTNLNLDQEPWLNSCMTLSKFTINWFLKYKVGRIAITTSHIMYMNWHIERIKCRFPLTDTQRNKLPKTKCNSECKQEYLSSPYCMPVLLRDNTERHNCHVCVRLPGTVAERQRMRVLCIGSVNGSRLPWRGRVPSTWWGWSASCGIQLIHLRGTWCFCAQW